MDDILRTMFSTATKLHILVSNNHALGWDGGRLFTFVQIADSFAPSFARARRIMRIQPFCLPSVNVQNETQRRSLINIKIPKRNMYILPWDFWALNFARDEIVICDASLSSSESLRGIGLFCDGDGRQCSIVVLERWTTPTERKDRRGEVQAAVQGSGERTAGGEFLLGSLSFSQRSAPTHSYFALRRLYQMY